MTQNQSKLRISKSPVSLNGAKIIAAPSREALFDASKYFRVRDLAEVSFTVRVFNLKTNRHQEAELIGYSVRGLAPADGSGMEWMGQVNFLSSPFVELPHSGPYDFFIDLRSREGIITDDRPLDERPHVDPVGDVWLKGRKIGNISDLRSL